MTFLLSQGPLSLQLTPSVPPAWNSNVASFAVAKHSSKIWKPLSIFETTSLFLKTRISFPRNPLPQSESLALVHDLTKKQTVSEIKLYMVDTLAHVTMLWSVILPILNFYHILKFGTRKIHNVWIKKTA